MKRLDRYVLGTFLRVFAGCLLVFAIAAVALDFFGRIGMFFDEARLEGTFAEDYSTLGRVARFYAAYLPYLLKEVLPFVTVAAGLFTLNALQSGNELLPLLAAGVSARRALRMVFVCGALVSLGHFAFQEHVVPALDREQVAMKRFFEGDKRVEREGIPHLRDGKGTVTRAAKYRYADRSLVDVVVQRPWTEAGFERWVVPVLEPDGDGWRSPAVVVVHPAGVGELPQALPPGAAVDIGVTPDEVEALASRRGAQEISLGQLRRLARKFPDRRHLQVATHKQVARPFTSFVLLLLGIPALLARGGRSVFLGGALAFAISASYYFLDIFLTSLGDRGDLAPALAAYLPPALFLSAGIARLATVPT